MRAPAGRITRRALSPVNHMFRTMILLSALLPLVACGEKKAPASSGSAAAASSEESIDGAKYPDDAASKAFVTRLIRVDAKDFEPMDAAGAKFIYKSVDFKNDNTWWAAAQMTADGETFDCKEQGTWEMDPAIDEHTAEMTWKLNRSSCAGRPQEGTLRLKVGIDGGEYRIVFR